MYNISTKGSRNPDVGKGLKCHPTYCFLVYTFFFKIEEVLYTWNAEMSFMLYTSEAICVVHQQLVGVRALPEVVD